MSLYRQAGRRSTAPLVAAGIVVALLGGLAGYLIGSSGDHGETSLEDAVARLQDEVRPALSELELVMIEYGEAVQGGRVVAETEYAASVDHVERASEALGVARDELEVISPEELGLAEAALNQLDVLIGERAPTARVNAAVARADAAIRAAARI